MAKSKHYYIRGTHRYLGLILGIQFLLWTIGGLYFSWSNIDEVHGDFQKRNAPLLPSNISLVSPTVVLDTIQKVHRIDSVVSIQLIEILGKPFYQVRCASAIHQQENHQHERPVMNHLANAVTGLLRGPLTKEEAIEVAKMRFNGAPVIKTYSLQRLPSSNSHTINYKISSNVSQRAISRAEDVAPISAANMEVRPGSTSAAVSRVSTAVGIGGRIGSCSA